MNPSRSLVCVMSFILSLVPAVCLATTSPAGAQSASLNATFLQANAAYSEGVSALSTDRAAAERRLADAAAAYQQILISNSLSAPDAARVLFNLGNAELLRGDAGRAVLNYRRAQALDPTIPGLADNLARARARAAGQPDTLIAGNRPAWVVPAMPWAFNRTLVLSLAAWSAAAFWAVILIRAVLGPDRVRPHWAFTIPPALLALASATWLTALVVRDRDSAGASVIVNTVTARSAPDTLTSDAIGAPLKPGTEMIAIELRQGADGQPWTRVHPREAGPAQSMWIPLATVEPVAPDRPLATTSR